MKKLLIFVVIIVFLLLALGLGYLIGSRGISSDDEDDDAEDSIPAPVWEKGRFWLYSFNTPDAGLMTSEIAVAGVEGENYMVGVNGRLDAQRHAVLNFNPMLGRIGTAGLEVYEKGELQPLFRFPLEVASNWSFSMFDIEDFEARVVSIQEIDVPDGNSTTIVTIEAKASSGDSLHYTYSTDARWVDSLRFERDGETVLEMTLVSYGTGYAGELFFVRGRDLFDRSYTSQRGSPTLEVYDTFIDQGHPSWGPFDNLIYFLEVETGDNTLGNLALRDHDSNTHLRKTFTSNTAESSLGAIPSDQGEWGVTVSILGESHLRLRVAGGLEYSWTV